MPEEKQLAPVREVFAAYWGEVRRHPYLLALTIVGGVGLQAADLASPWYLRIFFNTLATSAPSGRSVPLLLSLVLIVGALYLVSWAMRRLQDSAVMRLEARAMTALYDRTFTYLLGHSYDFFVSHFAGSLTHRVSKFVRAFEVMLDSIMLQFFPTFLFVCGAVTVLTVRNALLGIALGMWSVVFVLFQAYVAKWRQPSRSARAAADTRVTASLADAISNHATVQLFSGVPHESSLFRRVVHSWDEATIRAWRADNLIWGGIGLFMIGIEVGLLWGATVLWGRGEVTLGDFVLIQAYLITTFDRLVSINRELRRFNDSYADSSEMVAILNEAHGVPDRAGARALAVHQGAISFERVHFFFDTHKPVLREFTLQVRGGEKVALVGPSGAGKTTITKLLLRLFDVRAGAIRIDGQNIADVTQTTLRNAISFVPQEPVLFHRTLMENIRYGRRSATDEEIYEAARKAHCAEFIEALPLGYGTYVGERGVKLSGGERQRVAIARAILKNAPILVLDEATSSLDSESEALIQDALEVLMRGKTTLVIAHRLSTIQRVDRIIVLEKGRIVDEGAHEQLLERDGLYQKLWSIQAGGFHTERSDQVPEVEPDDSGEKEQPQGVTQK